jgi:hypothetical protein
VESEFGDGPAAGNRLGISQDEEAVKASCTEFIRAYRRKDAWLIEAFREALKVTTAENLLQAAKRFAAENKGKEARYIVGAAKWLSSKGWRAFPAPVKPALHSIASEPPPRRDVGEHTICRTWRYKSKLFEWRRGRHASIRRRRLSNSTRNTSGSRTGSTNGMPAGKAFALNMPA